MGACGCELIDGDDEMDATHLEVDEGKEGAVGEADAAEDGAHDKGPHVENVALDDDADACGRVCDVARKVAAQKRAERRREAFGAEQIVAVCGNFDAQQQLVVGVGGGVDRFAALLCGHPPLRRLSVVFEPKVKAQLLDLRLCEPPPQQPEKPLFAHVHCRHLFGR